MHNIRLTILAIENTNKIFVKSANKIETDPFSTELSGINPEQSKCIRPPRKDALKGAPRPILFKTIDWFLSIEVYNFF